MLLAWLGIGTLFVRQNPPAEDLDPYEDRFGVMTGISETINIF